MSENASPPFTLRLHPLLPVAALLFLGIVLGRAYYFPLPAILLIAGSAWLGWLVSDRLLRAMPAVLPSAFLGLAIVAAGAATWSINQNHVEGTHLVRFLPPAGEVPVTLRMMVLKTPAAPSHMNQYLMGRVTDILTETGWHAASGDALIQWRGGEEVRTPAAGQAIEVYGWASRPLPALNPGGIDQRTRLAADRIFVQVRVPRANGILPVDDAGKPGTSIIERLRLYLRGKFLGHILDQDVPGAYAMTALLLGYRDPAASDVSQAFTDAGVAHLLAISGSHIVFFAAMASCAVMLIPLRPRQREMLIAGIVGLYVLATPCGPPIIRAAVALAMLVISRLVGRPGQYLNMLAAAGILIVLWRPADIADAGFQLSFVSTAGLILFAERCYDGLFGDYLERQSLIAELAGTPWARRKVWMKKWVCGIIVANVIGAVTAAPLVAYHFGQANLWAVPAGIIALPVVSTAMVFGALQLLAELAGIGALLSVPTLLAGKGMIWVVQLLAALPGAVLAVRPPPWYLVVLLYAGMVLPAMRKYLHLSRAQTVNLCLGSLVMAAGWYAFTMPVNAFELTLLSTGQTSSLLVRTPRGDLWAIDAGAPRGSNPTTVLANALRTSGERRLAGLIVTHLDAPHASSAGDMLNRFRPAHVFVSELDWRRKSETLAAASLDSAASFHGTPIISVHAGQKVDLASGATLEILWPPVERDALGHMNLIARLSYSNRHILIADPHAEKPLAALMLEDPALRADVVVFTGQERGDADVGLRRIIAPLDARMILWTSRGSWAPRISAPDVRNAADGAIHLCIDAKGKVTLPL